MAKQTITIVLVRVESDSADPDPRKTIDVAGESLDEVTAIRPALAKCGAKVIEMQKRRAAK